MRLIDADNLKKQLRILFEGEEGPRRLYLQTLCYWIDREPEVQADKTPTIDNTDAYVRGYNAGVQMSIKLFLSLGGGGEDDDSVQM